MPRKKEKLHMPRPFMKQEKRLLSASSCPVGSPLFSDLKSELKGRTPLGRRGVLGRTHWFLFAYCFLYSSVEPNNAAVCLPGVGSTS